MEQFKTQNPEMVKEMEKDITPESLDKKIQLKFYNQYSQLLEAAKNPEGRSRTQVRSGTAPGPSQAVNWSRCLAVQHSSVESLDACQPLPARVPIDGGSRPSDRSSLQA